MVSKRRRLMALVLAVMTLLSVMAVGTFGASAASGDTVYCENAENWSTVYCYMWKDGAGENQAWPGVQMTKGENNLWSYKVTGDWDMVIFNGGEGQEQTENLAYKGNGSCYNNSTKQWTTVDTPDVPTTPVDPTTPNNPVNPPTPTGGTTVYFKNTANWSKVNVYRPNDDPSKALVLDHGYDETKPVSELGIEDMQKAAEFRGGSVVSKKMKKGDMRTKLVWKCGHCGEEFEASPTLILKGGHWCPHCYLPGIGKAWNYDEITKSNPFFAQVWYTNHTKEENNVYEFDRIFDGWEAKK